MQNDINLTNEFAEQPPSFFPYALRYGLIGGAAYVVFILLQYLLEMSDNLWLGFLGPIVISLLTAYLAINAYKEACGGFLSLGKGFATGLVANLVTGLVGGLFTYVYLNFIDPESLEIVLKTTQDLLESFGLPEEAMEEALEQTEQSLTSTGSIFSTAIGLSVYGGIASIIIAAILKNEPKFS